ncbi:hypothetical protein T190423A01A_90016 [Tenacibaculum sp. 190130A14a]|uniref:Uncharacterized protein n=1 Tax=Tenacibaculum polynesiense TaxID=3137857 RepID=A0ABM9PG36_9FLAO
MQDQKITDANKVYSPYPLRYTPYIYGWHSLIYYNFSIQNV